MMPQIANSFQRRRQRALHAGRNLRSVLLFCAAGSLSCLSINCAEGKTKQASGKIVYDFLANANKAEVAHYHRERVNFGQEFTINKEKRPILFEHPNAEVQFNGVAIPQNAVLQFGMGINPEVWDKSGDGVTFEVTVIDGKSGKTMIFSKYIDPKNNVGDRKWHDQNVDLKDFVGQTVSFLFSTTAGPRGNTEFDWAGWSNPKIRLLAGEGSN